MRLSVLWVFVILSSSVRLTAQEVAVADTEFSVDRGFYSQPFQVEITTETVGATIRYTLDGSAPSPTHGNDYVGPLSISTTTVLRAMAFKNGEISTNVDTQTYLFVDDVIEQPATITGYPNPSYPLSGNSSITAVHDYEMDPAIVDDPAYSGEMTAAMLAIPSMSLVVDPGEIFGAGGFYDASNVEKVCSIEILYPGEPEANEQAEAGIESHSHMRMKRSLRLNFRSEYGDSKLDSDLFRRMPVGGDSATDNFDRIILRAGNNRSWARLFSKEKTTYALDEFVRQSQVAMSGYGMRGAFVHLYINGLYWGLYNPVERADQWFSADYFGGEQEDWFVANHGGDLSGDDTRYDYLRGDLKDLDMSDPINYAELGEYLDLEGFVEYLLLQWYCVTSDWPQNNWYAGNRNATSPLGLTKHRYFIWDGEWSWDLPHSSVSNQNLPPYDAWVHPNFRASEGKNQGLTRTIANLFNSAKDNPVFLRLLADQFYEHFFNDGSMSESEALARWTVLSEMLRAPAIAESARWGDTMEGLGEPTFTRDDHWSPEVSVITGLITGRLPAFIANLRTEGYYPSVDPPQWSQHGGLVSPGFQLTMSNPNPDGTIFYTLDGSDPDSVGALTYQGAITISNPAEVKARVLSAGGEWSALHRAIFLLPDPPALRVTEIMYHPAEPSAAEIAAGYLDQDQFEFIELRNIGEVALDISGIQFVDGIGYVFAPGTVLAPGAYTLLVSDLSAFEFRFGMGYPVAGTYSGRLRNSGEELLLTTNLNQTIHKFDYEDDWYLETDGPGNSLRILNEFEEDFETWDRKYGWFGSVAVGGTPGDGEALLVDAWRMRFFASLDAEGTGLEESFMNDGIPNLLKYALDVDPTQTTTLASVVTVALDGNTLLQTYPRYLEKTDITYESQFSTDLDDWVSVAEQVSSNDGIIEMREAMQVLDQSNEEGGFLRLKVTPQ